MKLLFKKQALLIAGAIVLFFLLVFANKKAPQRADNKAEQKQEHTEISIESIIDEVKSSLPSDKRELFAEMEAKLGKANDFQKLILLDSLVKLSGDLKKADMAAYYEEQIALKKQTPDNWLKAGNRFYTATAFAKEEHKPYLYQSAINSFLKVLASDSTNNNAKVSLAVCYVETSNPMLGISMLKEVVKTDSTNVNASFNLGIFAIKSGQNDKAVEHFNRVLRINPAYYEAYLYMAEAYEKDSNKIKAIESLEKYANFVNDVTIKTEIQNYINKLRNS